VKIGMLRLLWLLVRTMIGTLIEPTGVPPGAQTGDASAASDAITQAVVTTIGAIGVPMFSYMVVTAVTLGPPTTCSIVPPQTPGGPALTPLTGVKVMAGFVPYVGQTVIVGSVGTDTFVWGSTQGGSGTDVGLIGWFQQVPSGGCWVILNGGTFSATTFPMAYAKLGTNVLPDLRNKFVVGAGGTYAEGTTPGAATATLTQVNLPNVTLSEKTPFHKHSPLSNGAFYGNAAGGTSGVTNAGVTVEVGADPTTAAVASPGVQVSLGGSATPLAIIPPSYALYPCQKLA